MCAQRQATGQKRPSIGSQARPPGTNTPCSGSTTHPSAKPPGGQTCSLNPSPPPTPTTCSSDSSTPSRHQETPTQNESPPQFPLSSRTSQSTNSLRHCTGSASRSARSCGRPYRRRPPRTEQPSTRLEEHYVCT